MKAKFLPSIIIQGLVAKVDMYILEQNLATVKIKKKNQSIILVYVKFPQGRFSCCCFMVGLASFPSCEETHYCNISIYLMKIRIILVSLLSFCFVLL